MSHADVRFHVRQTQLDINDFFNASDCSSVIRLNGDPPPMDSYASLLFGALSICSPASRKRFARIVNHLFFELLFAEKEREKRAVCQLINHESSSDDYARTNTNTRTNNSRVNETRSSATTKIKSKNTSSSSRRTTTTTTTTITKFSLI